MPLKPRPIAAPVRSRGGLFNSVPIIGRGTPVAPVSTGTNQRAYINTPNNQPTRGNSPGLFARAATGLFR